MKRQGLNVTPKQLREIADYLENEFRLLFEKTAKMENELNKETNHLMKVLA